MYLDSLTSRLKERGYPASYVEELFRLEWHTDAQRMGQERKDHFNTKSLVWGTWSADTSRITKCGLVGWFCVLFHNKYTKQLTIRLSSSCLAPLGIIIPSDEYKVPGELIPNNQEWFPRLHARSVITLDGIVVGDFVNGPPLLVCGNRFPVTHTPKPSPFYVHTHPNPHCQ